MATARAISPPMNKAEAHHSTVILDANVWVFQKRWRAGSRTDVAGAR
jgi:hypothetical protein